jgi:hypothetical protein
MTGLWASFTEITPFGAYRSAQEPLVRSLRGDFLGVRGSRSEL